MRRHKALAACAALLMVGAVTATFQSVSQSLTVPQLCTKAASALQQCSPATLSGKDSTCCKALSWMQELGCLCLNATKDASRSALSPDAWASAPLCELDINLGACSSAAGSTNLPAVPGVISVPGKGFVQASAVVKDLEGSLVVTQPVSRTIKADSLQDVDTRPVLDLSTVPDDVTLLFEAEGDAEVSFTVTESEDGSGDTSLVFDLQLPESLVADELEFEIETTESDSSNDWDELSFTVDMDAQGEDVTVEIETEFDGGTEAVYTTEVITDTTVVPQSLEEVFEDALVLEDIEEFSLEVSDDDLVRQLSEPRDFDEELTVEMDVELPEGVLQTFGASDVTIEMEVDFEDGQAISETNITVQQGSGDLPMSGQGLGNLLIEAAEWLSAFLPMPLTDDSCGSADDSVAGMLGGALQLMSEVGEEISELIPDQRLNSGDTIEVVFGDDAAAAHSAIRWVEASDSPRVGPPGESIARLSGRKAMDSLTEAISSALYSKQAEQQVQRQVSCTICSLVHQHIQLLWAVVYVNIALLALCCGVAAYKTLPRSATPVPTVPESDLTQPLIVNAADFVDPELKIQAVLGACSLDYEEKLSTKLQAQK